MSESDGAKYVRTHTKYKTPSRDVSLRTIDPITFKLVNSNLPEIVDGKADANVIDLVEYTRAFFECFPGAIYLHQGQSFLVTSLNLETHKAYAVPTSVSYFTSAMDATDVKLVARYESSEVVSGCHTGVVDIVTSVYGFKKIKFHSNEEFERQEFVLPPVSYRTRGLWIDLNVDVLRRLSVRSSRDVPEYDPMGAIHAANHVVKRMCTDVVARCEPTSLQCVHVDVNRTRTTNNRLVVFDNSPGGGLGVCESVFPHAEKILRLALALVRACPCARGCLECVLDPNCLEFNGRLDKKGCVVLLAGVLEHVREPTAVVRRDLSVVSTPQKDRRRGMRAAKEMHSVSNVEIHSPYFHSHLKDKSEWVE